MSDWCHQAGGAIIAATIAASFVVLVPKLDPQFGRLALLYAAICAIAVNVRGYASEFHPQNRAAKTVVAKMQVTGLVTLVTCSATAAAIGIAMVLVHLRILPTSPLIPAPLQLLHAPTMVLALIAGVNRMADPWQ